MRKPTKGEVVVPRLTMSVKAMTKKEDQKQYNVADGGGGVLEDVHEQNTLDKILMIMMT